MSCHHDGDDFGGGGGDDGTSAQDSGDVCGGDHRHVNGAAGRIGYTMPRETNSLFRITVSSESAFLTDDFCYTIICSKMKYSFLYKKRILDENGC
jgi:hypothetical protein